MLEFWESPHHYLQTEAEAIRAWRQAAQALTHPLR